MQYTALQALFINCVLACAYRMHMPNSAYKGFVKIGIVCVCVCVINHDGPWPLDYPNFIHSTHHTPSRKHNIWCILDRRPCLFTHKWWHLLLLHQRQAHTHTHPIWMQMNVRWLKCTAITRCFVAFPEVLFRFRLAFYIIIYANSVLLTRLCVCVAVCAMVDLMWIVARTHTHTHRSHDRNTLNTAYASKIYLCGVCVWVRVNVSIILRFFQQQRISPINAGRRVATVVCHQKAAAAQQ